MVTDVAHQLPVVAQSTTSRVILDNDLMHVVEFTFDEGERLSEHSTPKAVVVQLIEGTMAFTIDGKENILQAGDVVYIAPNAPHALVAQTPCRLSLVMVQLDEQAEENR